jgi:sterol desaturase/sphingolipid hydroxylase (fatty acid hydroxylase superfamily)
LSWMPLWFASLVWLRLHILGHSGLMAPRIQPRAFIWIVGLLAGDFLLYVTHAAQHRYDFLWNFHAIHHSQQEVNLFTQDRTHDIDLFISATAGILPLVLLSPRIPDLGIYYAVTLMYERLNHAPIRSNYGLLRYILVSPQSHRIHHASDFDRQNSNFGTLLNLWDRVFGTQYPSYDEYAEQFGIRDPVFPVEQGVSSGQFPAVYAAQLVYPFSKILRSMGSTARSEEPHVLNDSAPRLVAPRG